MVLLDSEGNPVSQIKRSQNLSVNYCENRPYISKAIKISNFFTYSLGTIPLYMKRPVGPLSPRNLIHAVSLLASKKTESIPEGPLDLFSRFPQLLMAGTLHHMYIYMHQTR